MSNTVELIKQDHRKVEQLFAQFRESHDPDIVDQICTELTVHARYEEELVYPLLKAKVDAEDASHAQHEHDEAKAIIAEMQNGDAEGDALAQLVSKLEQSISHHVEEEESDILPHMEQTVGDQLQAMFADVVARKEQLMEEEENDPEMLNLAKEELRARVEAMTSH